MSEENVEILRGFAEAFNDHDFDDALRCLSSGSLSRGAFDEKR
jgi:hypothetical protein